MDVWDFPDLKMNFYIVGCIREDLETRIKYACAMTTKAKNKEHAIAEMIAINTNYGFVHDCILYDYKADRVPSSRFNESREVLMNEFKLKHFKLED